jgi:hypothetical protein
VATRLARAWRNHAEELARHGAILDQLQARDRQTLESARNGTAHIESGDGRRIDRGPTSRPEEPRGLLGSVIKHCAQLISAPEAIARLKEQKGILRAAVYGELQDGTRAWIELALQ